VIGTLPLMGVLLHLKQGLGGAGAPDIALRSFNKKFVHSPLMGGLVLRVGPKDDTLKHLLTY